MSLTPTSPSNIIIEVVDLEKRFGDFTAVNKISFSVRTGQIFGFLGPNGAGKSTTIKMLTTLLAPSSGTLKLAGFDVAKEQAETRKSFGIVFQDPSVDEDLTALENMQVHAALYGLSNKDINGRTKELLDLVELWDRRNNQVKTFSGGMKRRLEIARGLLHHPKVLFLDEPTLGLDTQTRNLLWSYVKALVKSEGMTVFFTTHYLEEAEEIADEIAIIDHGVIVAHGSSAHLMSYTNTETLEEAYLKLTGKAVRDETADPKDSLRTRRRARGSR
ncbi:MAG: ATP-binding cassette domain-containing protein [Candidatus Saccharimonadia bacterium]